MSLRTGLNVRRLIYEALIRDTMEVREKPEIWDCTTCLTCTKRCPTSAISGQRDALHVIDPELCIDCGACGVVCPVECIHPPEGWDGNKEGNQLYINPDDCIDCTACVAECPVEAIFSEDDIPDEWNKYIEINRARFA